MGWTSDAMGTGLRACFSAEWSAITGTGPMRGRRVDRDADRVDPLIPSHKSYYQESLTVASG